MSESDVFVRTPEPRSRRTSSPRSIPSPVTKKHQTNTLAIASHRQTTKPIEYLSPSQIVPTTERQISERSTSEYGADDSYEN